jgi:hypothetical protein
MANLKIDIYSILIFALLVVTLSTVVSIEKEQKAAFAIYEAENLQEASPAEFKNHLEKKREAIFENIKSKAWADVVTTDELIMKLIAHGYVFAILLLILPIAIIAFTQWTRPQPSTNKEINHD